MRIAIFREHNIPLPPSEVKKIFRVIGRRFPRYQRAAVSVAFVTDQRVRQLNTWYRRKRQVTDVLSFAERDSARGSRRAGYLGEIVIAYRFVRQRAIRNRRSVSADLALMLVHGFLHLIGYDHRQAAGARRMEQQQQYLMDRLKFPYYQ